MGRLKKIIDGEVQVDPFLTQLRIKIIKGLETGSVGVDLYRPDEEEEEKSDEQRCKFHAMIGDINKKCIIRAPSIRVDMSSYNFKRCKSLLVIWFYKEKLLNGEAIPNPPTHFTDPLSGEEITERPSTMEWGKKLTSEFVEYLYATGVTGGTIWSEPALKEYAEWCNQTKLNR